MPARMTTQRGALWLALALGLAAPQACKVEEADNDGCSDDNDCKGDRVCDDGECVDPDEASSSRCDAVGDACGPDSCCGDAVCVQYSGDQSFTVCEAPCVDGSQCPSGCCLPVGDGSVSTCSPAEYCGAGGGPPGPSGSGGSGGSGGGPGGPGSGGETPAP